MRNGMIAVLMLVCAIWVCSIHPEDHFDKTDSLNCPICYEGPDCPYHW